MLRIPLQPLHNPPQEPSAKQLSRCRPRPPSCVAAAVARRHLRAGGQVTVPGSVNGHVCLAQRGSWGGTAAMLQPLLACWFVCKHFNSPASAQPQHQVPIPCITFVSSWLSVGSASLRAMPAVVPAVSWTPAACPVDGQTCSPRWLGCRHSPRAD